MAQREATWTTPTGEHIHTYEWLPETREPQAIVQIYHGMAEHGGRYQRFAKHLTDAGFGVYALDWRGHGQTCTDRSALGHLGTDGFELMVTDALGLRDDIQAKWPTLPIFLFGHSMGSFAAIRAMQRGGAGYTGVILCGSQGKLGPSLDLAIALAKRDARRIGDAAVSARMVKLTFGGYNRHCQPRRTLFDWLSRDAAEVDAYVADERCGFGLTVGSLRDMYIGLRTMHRVAEMKRIPSELPIFLIAGTMDPVGGYGKSVRKLEQELVTTGHPNVTCKLYPGARHELLNEINRDEVMEDILSWLDLYEGCK